MFMREKAKEAAVTDLVNQIADSYKRNAEKNFESENENPSLEE